MRSMRADDTSSSPPAYRDRSGRLAVFGLLTALLGGAALLFALLNLALPVLGRLLPGQLGLGSEPRTALMGFLTYGLIGGILIWAGVGSLRKRRWVRPVMLTVAWTWLILGLLSVALAVVLFDDLLRLGSLAEPVPSEVILIVKTVVLGILAVGGLLLPALLILIYRDEQIRLTCERYDPRPAWTDLCPDSVLALSMLLWVAAALLLPMALQPAVPLFGVLVTGWWGAALLVLGALISAWLARAVYRLSMAAWWITTVVLVLAGLSVAVTFQIVEPGEYYRAIGYPEAASEDLPTPERFWKLATVWSTVALTLVSVIYMIAIRRHFSAARAADPAKNQT
jgi:hypothetical protein